MNNDTRREALLSVIAKFARSRPGLDFANYGDIRAYRSESASITRDLRHAESLLAAIGWRDGITADKLLEASRNAFSGRLKITEAEPGQFKLDYCAGQYYPTEYRRAVCAVLSSALWDYFRESLPEDRRTGDNIRKSASRELPRAVAARWFR